MTLTPDEVLAEAAAWVWAPDFADVVRTEEYVLVAYPEHFAEPTMAFQLTTQREPNRLVDDVLDAAGGLGRTTVAFSGLSEATRPPTLEPRLAERGELCETLAVLARPLAELPDLAVPDDVELRQVLDLDTLSDLDRVETEVFGGTARSEEQLTQDLPRVVADTTEPRWVAYRDGAAVGAAGLALVGGTARFWGGAVRPAAQHTGVYRALLQQRLEWSRTHGAQMALVKGRVETSAPTLLRAGFTAYGEERAYRVTRP